MDLILWRHADAFDEENDLDRELTPKGHAQATAMAAWLKPRLPDNLHILASPAMRTRQTAEALEQKFDVQAALAPDRPVMDLLLAAGWPQGNKTVLIVGHQPTLGLAAMLLLTGSEIPFSIKKGGIIWISNRVRQESEQTILRAALSPELLKSQ